MLIKTLLWPTIKKNFIFYLSILAVSLLGIALLVGLVSSYSSLCQTYDNFNASYGYPDISVEADSYFERSIIKDLEKIDGVEKATPQYVMDFSLNNNGRIISTRTRVVSKDDIYKIEVTEKSEKEYPFSILMHKSFAKNNNFKIDDSVKIGLYGYFIDLHISGIAISPQTVYVSQSNYYTSDAVDFGYTFIYEEDFKKICNDLLPILIENKDKIPISAAEINPLIKFIQLAGVDEIIDNSCNIINFKIKDGYDKNIVMNNILDYFEEEGISLYDYIAKEDTQTYKFEERCTVQVKAISYVAPTMFFIIMIVIVFLFLNQIIKGLTREIGILNALGESKANIFKFLALFSLIMSLISCVLGVLGGLAVSKLMCNVYYNLYSIPKLQFKIDPLITLIAIFATILVGQISTFITGFKINKMQPKDAISNCYERKKNLPEKIAKITRKAPANILIALNSIYQSPKRLIISIFSIFASFVVIFIGCSMKASSQESAYQFSNKMAHYDAQVYLYSYSSESIFDEISNLDSVTKVEKLSIAFCEVESPSVSKNFSIIGIPDDCELLTIFDTNQKPINSFDGLVVENEFAKELGVKKGDYLKVNDKDILVSEISDIYIGKTIYASFNTVKSLGGLSSETYLVNTNNQIQFLDDMGKLDSLNKVVFTENLSKSFYGATQAFQIGVLIIIGFAILIGFAVITMMIITSMTEQKKNISIMMSVGYTKGGVSTILLIQTLIHIAIGLILGVPVGILTSKLAVRLTSNATETFPFINVPSNYFIAIGLIFAFIFVSYVVALFKMKKWNLAENTKSRE